jgi:hypothetical protein
MDSKYKWTDERSVRVYSREFASEREGKKEVVVLKFRILRPGRRHRRRGQANTNPAQAPTAPTTAPPAAAFKTKFGCLPPASRLSESR